MAKNPELVGFNPTIRKPSPDEATRIVANQTKNPDTEIVCVYSFDNGDFTTTTRIPFLHKIHKMEKELSILAEEMQEADFFQIIDKSDKR